MKKEQIILLTLAGVNFTHIVDSMIMMPLGDIFMKMFGIGPGQFSILVSSYAAGAFLSSILGMFILDIFDRKKALLTAYAGFTIGTLGCAMAWSYESLLIIRFTTGMFGGVIGAIVLSIVSDTFPFQRRGKAMGILMAAFSAAAALGVPLGLFLADYFTWRAPFIFVGALGLLLNTLILAKFPVMVDHFNAGAGRKSPKYVIWEITSDRNQINALILGCVLVFGHFLIIPFIAPYMTRNVGFSQSEITYIYFLGGALTVFSAPFIGKMTDRFGPKNMFLIVMLLSFIPTVWITNLPEVSIPIALIATSLFFVLGSGRMIPPQTQITAAVGPSNRGSFMSVKSALQQLAIALASLISGVIVYFDDQEKLMGYNLVGYLAIAVCLVAIALSRNLKVADGN